MANGKQGETSRYRQGVSNPRPELVEAIREALEADPGINKSELARRVGVSRQTVNYYLRAMGKELQEVASRRQEVKDRATLSHLDLLDRLAGATEEIGEIIRELREQPMTPALARAAFNGYSVLERYNRLIGELLGEVSPPTQNVYITKIEALLNAPLEPGALPNELRECLEQHG